jgi:polysaccharide biosynthesis/export protein
MVNLARTTILLALLSSLIAATDLRALAQTVQRPPQTTQTAPAAPRPAQPTPAVPAPPPPTEYTIGPEDVLGIVFWREPDLSGDVTVRPDGRITLPVIGEVQAAGRRPQVLQSEIAAAASKYISSVNVAVIVRAIHSRKVFVTGRVTTPGAYPLMQPLTVMQAIALAGGLTEFADAKGITILRVENGKSRTVPFNYQDIARGKSLDQNVMLLPGDTVVVP